jgi:uncharacterized protein (TIGR02246 family)
MCPKGLKATYTAILSVLLASFLLTSTRAAQQKSLTDKQLFEARLRALEDREEIRHLLVDYGRTLDRRDFKAFSELFADNAEYISRGQPSVKGPAAIARFLENVFQKNPTSVRSPNFHLFANVIIRVNGDQAEAVSKGLFVVPGQKNMPEIAMIATYNDTLVKDRGRWKFQKRVVTGDIPGSSTKK